MFGYLICEAIFSRTLVCWVLIFFISVLIIMLVVVGLLRFPVCLWFSLRRLYVSRNVFISSSVFMPFTYFIFVVVQVQLSPFFPHHSPLPPPSIWTPFGFVHGSFIHVPWWPFPFVPPLPTLPHPCDYCQFVLYSLSLVIFCLFACLFCCLVST